MQLYCDLSAPTPYVVAWYADGVSVPAGAHPGATLISFDGFITDLDKVGAPPADGEPDQRPYKAPTVDLAAYARARSYDVRVSGTSVNGMPVKTDPDTLSLINGMAALAQQDSTQTFSFDTGAAVVSLTATQAIAISTAVGKWVQGTFTKRASVLADIASGKIKTTADVDAAFAS